MDDAKTAFRPGHFVWSNFPYEEDPLKPGPEEHLVYISRLAQLPNGTIVATCVYTTSRPWNRSEKPPIGIIPIGGEFAAQLEQRPFVIDARRIAYVPINLDFFRHLNTPTHGILKKKAPLRLQEAVLNVMADVSKRPEYKIELGPYRPIKGRER